ncbi:MAG: hypothetical protein ACI30Q_04305, partial [Muribaculaceae bacterium]
VNIDIFFAKLAVNFYRHPPSETLLKNSSFSEQLFLKHYTPLQCRITIFLRHSFKPKAKNIVNIGKRKIERFCNKTNIKGTKR